MNLEHEFSIFYPSPYNIVMLLSVICVYAILEMYAFKKRPFLKVSFEIALFMLAVACCFANDYFFLGIIFMAIGLMSCISSVISLKKYIIVDNKEKMREPRYRHNRTKPTSRQ